tara:strand:- start:2158 stop:2889 length:732 start_codon:yes stop_codon:yes gene_type:complete
MHEMGIDASNIAVNQVLGDLDVKFQKEIGTALQEDQVTWKKFLQKDTGATKLATSGVTGRSAARIGTLELGEYLAKGSRKAYELTESRQELDKAGQKAVNMAKAEQMNSFAKNNIIRNPDLAPPQPVMQNVGMAALMDGLSIAGSLMGIGTGIAGINAAGGVGAWLSGGVSDRRLKENIKKIGESKSGLGIYKFNYIGQVKQYIGTMADEVIKVVPEAVVRMSNGYFGVRYDLIDVTFKEVTP